MSLYFVLFHPKQTLESDARNARNAHLANICSSGVVRFIAYLGHCSGFRSESHFALHSGAYLDVSRGANYIVNGSGSSAGTSIVSFGGGS